MLNPTFHPISPVSPGSNVFMISTVPPACSAGFEKQFSPPVWNSGSTVTVFTTCVIFMHELRLTAFQNVMFLRDARAAGLRPDWLILAGFPGEQEAVYAKYLHDLPLLTHLQPPMGVIQVRFDRFSAYFEDPGRYGLDLRPMRFYELIYPFSPEALRDLAYYFYDATPDPEYKRTCERYLPRLRALVLHWQQRWRAGQPPGLRFVAEGSGPDGAVVMDTRAGPPAFRRVSPAGVALLEALRRPLTLAKAAERCGLDEDRAAGELLRLQADGLIFTERGKHLSLVTA